MKLQTILAALVIAATSTMSFAADEAKPMAPHSHVQEKTGMAPSAAPAADKKAAEAATPDEKKGAKKATKKHLHPRDGK